MPPGAQGRKLAFVSRRRGSRPVALTVSSRIAEDAMATSDAAKPGDAEREICPEEAQRPVDMDG